MPEKMTSSKGTWEMPKAIWLMIFLCLLPFCMPQVPPSTEMPPTLAGEKRANEESLPAAYCGANDPVPIPTFNCSTCKGRCGATANYSPGSYCSCDPNCVAHRDCCIDFEESCRVEFQAGEPLRTNSVSSGSATTCVWLQTQGSQDVVGFDVMPSIKRVSLVSVCSRTGETCDTTWQGDLLKPNLAIPVIDPSIGTHYINYECAKCNGVQRVIPYGPKIYCEPGIDVLEKNGTQADYKVADQTSLKFYLDRGCSVNFVIPKQFPVRTACLNYQRSCPTSCQNNKLIKMCTESNIADLISPSGAFRGSGYGNYYCTLCNGEVREKLECAEVFPTLPGSRFEPGSFSLSLLFDFDPSEGVTVGRKACTEGQRWIDSLQSCRQVSCPNDFRLLNEQCIPKQLRIGLFANIYFNITGDLKAFNDMLHRTAPGDNVVKQLEPSLPIGDKLDASINTATGLDKSLNITLTLNIVFSDNSTFDPNIDLGNFSTNALGTFEGELVLTLHNTGINLGSVIISLSGNVSSTLQLFTNCTWTRIAENEYDITNGSLLLHKLDELFPPDAYRLVQSGALVCLPETAPTHDIKLDVSAALGILTLILISLSIICLSIRIVLQFKIAFYWSFVGRIHFHLALSLCLAFLMLLLGGITAHFSVHGLCAAFGILMYYFFLAAFFWMAAVTFDTWLVFRPSASFIKAENTNKALTRYALPCWMLPAALTAITTAPDYTDIDPRFKPLFGTNICWFNRRFALLSYFGAPVGALVLITTLLFIVTVVNIRRTLNASIRVDPDKTSHQIKIYFRLFTLMGVSWIIGFVAAFVGHDALWIIFIVLNASQGILIFVSFVLQKQVTKELCKTLTPREPSSLETPLGSSTISTGGSAHANPDSKHGKLTNSV